MDLSVTKDILDDYFGLVLPDSVLEKIINSDQELQREVIENTITDTAARDLLINVIGTWLGIKVNVPNMFGKRNDSSWPMYGDSAEYATAYFQQFAHKVKALGGTFNND